MYGAILGDMIGAPYEFDMGGKTKDFPLFVKASQFTDDTVMTIAVAEALLDTPDSPDDEIKTALVRSMRAWGKKYPRAGYGRRFRKWLSDKKPEPYGSYGNGSAMRVSSAGWLYGSIYETRRVARLTAEVTHNHPEGVKGAEATASAIYLARTGADKRQIRDYIVNEFGYDLSRTCDEIRPTYYHVESCQQTVPEALTAFLEGVDFEDVIRTAVSLGGDCDTLTCIAGGVAEAFYGVPALYKADCKARLPQDMLDVLTRFDAVRERVAEVRQDPLDGNAVIEATIREFYALQNDRNPDAVLEAVRRRMLEGGHFMIPVIPSQAFLDMADPERLKVGDTLTATQDLSFQPRRVETTDGGRWLAAFTSQEASEKGEASCVLSIPIAHCLKNCKEMPEDGVILNPWEKSFLLTKETIRLILDADKPGNHIYFDVGDITALEVDAIVNSTNPSIFSDAGVSGAIFRAAGPALEKECRKLNGCESGQAKITGAGQLKAKRVIHTVGPVYSANAPDCEKILRSCYDNVLELAKERGLHSVAFPAIATGACGYPKQEAARVALSTVSDWLAAHAGYEMSVIMNCRTWETRQYYQNVINACANVLNACAPDSK